MKERPKIVIKPKGTGKKPVPKPNPPKSLSSFWERAKHYIRAHQPRLMIMGIAAAVLLLAILAFGLLSRPNPSSNTNVSPATISETAPPSSSFFIPEINTTGYTDSIDVISRSESLGNYLLQLGIPANKVQQMVDMAKEYRIDSVRAGNDIYLLTDKGGRTFYVYQIDNYNYAEMHFHPLPGIKPHRLKVDKHLVEVGGIVKSTLWKAFEDAHVRSEILSQLEEALQWKVDFYHLLPGAKFKVIYEEMRAGKQFIKTGQLVALYFENEGTPLYAFYFKDSGRIGYYDEKGNTMKSSFLMSPVKYGRISSSFNLNRLHPVLKTNRPHFGTDYAAPEGTPIRAVADGKINKASFTRNNGNFVKIWHDPTYQTQYLHMQRIADGMKPGARVRQGDIIGYVGQTGLATGPHVCFRFWKNGKQVNHLKEKFTQSSRVDLDEKELFQANKDSLLVRLNGIAFY